VYDELLFRRQRVAGKADGNEISTTMLPRPDERDNPVKEVIGDMEGDYKKADAQHEDIIDRAFAPLDDIVANINRDLNDESGDSAIPKTSDQVVCRTDYRFPAEQ
jgi:hypothetical protein